MPRRRNRQRNAAPQTSDQQSVEQLQPQLQLNRQKSDIEGVQHGLVPSSIWTASLATRTEPVDSWRSYRNDTTNLQSLSTFNRPARLDPTVAEFKSVSQHRREPIDQISDQPLRDVHGREERRSVQQVRSYSTRKSEHLLGAYNQDAFDRDCNQVLPSVENDLRYTGPVSSVSKHATIASRLRSSKTPVSRSFTRELSTYTPEPPPAPSPTSAYLLQAGLEPIKLDEPQKLLVILDLNGTLLYRKNRARSPTNFQPRPGVTQLLHYLFDHHVVMIYTSARPENAIAIVDKLLHPNQRGMLAAVWARDKLDLTKEQYHSKVQVYKKLEKVWNDRDIQAAAGERRCWDQSNTVLVDDSHLKALAQPHNLLQVPEFINDRPSQGGDIFDTWNKIQQDILKQLELKLEELRWTGDVSRLIRTWQNVERAVPVVPGQQVMVDESVDQGKLHVKQEKSDASEKNAQLPTPRNSEECSADLSESTTTHQAAK